MTNHCQPFACSHFESFFSCHSEGALRSPCHSDPERSEGEESHGSGQALRPKNLLSLEALCVIAVSRSPEQSEGEAKQSLLSLHGRGLSTLFFLSLEGRGLRACPEFIEG